MPKQKAPKGKWLLDWGIHDGTPLGREMCPPIICDTEEDAHKALAAEKAKFLPWIRLWFATLYDDQGNSTDLGTHIPR